MAFLIPLPCCILNVVFVAPPVYKVYLAGGLGSYYDRIGSCQWSERLAIESIDAGILCF
jgi:hypothetical protein